MRKIRQIAAATTALTFMLQNLAWATCSDNITQFPPVASNPGGFTFGSAPLSTFVGAGTFTNTLGSLWVPDTSVFEHNDPRQPATNGGHEWVFDQGTTTCKITDVGPAGGTPTSWSIPTVVAPDCFFLPVVGGTTTITITLNGKPVQISMPLIRGITDVPQRNDVLTPTCDPTLLAVTDPATGKVIPNPLSTQHTPNTRLNQLGCSISHGVQTDAAHATSYMFTSGIRSGLSVVPLVNTTAGSDAGKVATRGSDLYTSSSVLNQKLDTAVISRDGQFLFGASSKNGPNVYACLNPLGDPGDPSLPINPFFAVPPAATVKCVQIGNAQQSRVLGMAMGSDGQLYMANNANVTTFTGFPACLGPLFANGGPPCTSVVNDTLSLGPGIKAETQAFVSHGNYLYRAIKGGALSQFKLVTTTGTTGTTITARNYAIALPSPTGIGFSNTLNAMLVYGDPSGIGAPGAEVVVKLPICEDIP
jgi:hypothetical protein